MGGHEGEPGEGPERSEPIRVMVVDDHQVWRDGIKADLEADGSAVVVAEAADGGEAIEVAGEAVPDVILMDLQLRTVSGTQAIRRIAEHTPNAKILVLSVSGEEADVLEAIKAGATGYLLKSTPAREVVDGVRRVANGEPVFTPSLAGLVLSEFRRLAAADPAEPGLSARENEVLKLVAKGYSYREIAGKLFLSVKTVQNHIQNILSKLQMHSRYELIRYAIQKGLDRTPE